MPVSNLKIRVPVALSLNEQQKAQLVDLGADYIAKTPFDIKNPQGEISQRIGDAGIIVINSLVPIDLKFLNRHPNIKFIQSASDGLDNIDLAATKAKGIIVENACGFSTHAVAERTMGLMLMASSHVVEANQDLKNGAWNSLKFVGKELRGRTLVLLGLGKIGQRVFELASAFGMKIQKIGSSTSKQDFHSALGAADYLSLHCPYTPQTHKIIDEQAFRRIKKGAILINTARGRLVDEAQLLSALNSDRISYAALDVLCEMPPRPDNPLVPHNRVFVTPYTAWNTEEAILRRNETIVENIKQFLLKQKVYHE